MKSAEKEEPVTALVRIAGNAFAVTRREDGVSIRRMPRPAPAPEGQVARVVVFPWARVREGR